MKCEMHLGNSMQSAVHCKLYLLQPSTNFNSEDHLNNDTNNKKLTTVSTV